MAKRSPILGYNHNVRYRGLIFHVQTEDSGVLSPHLFTHLFHSGVIVSTRKLVYDAGSDEGAIKSLMQAQHKAVMKDLRRGAFDDKIDQYLGGTPGLLPRGTTDESTPVRDSEPVLPAPDLTVPSGAPEISAPVELADIAPPESAPAVAPEPPRTMTPAPAVARAMTPAPAVARTMTPAPAVARTVTPAPAVARTATPQPAPRPATAPVRPPTPPPTPPQYEADDEIGLGHFTAPTARSAAPPAPARPDTQPDPIRQIQPRTKTDKRGSAPSAVRSSLAEPPPPSDGLDGPTNVDSKGAVAAAIHNAQANATIRMPMPPEMERSPNLSDSMNDLLALDLEEPRPSRDTDVFAVVEDSSDGVPGVATGRRPATESVQPLPPPPASSRPSVGAAALPPSRPVTRPPARPAITPPQVVSRPLSDAGARGDSDAIEVYAPAPPSVEAPPGAAPERPGQYSQHKRVSQKMPAIDVSRERSGAVPIPAGLGRPASRPPQPPPARAATPPPIPRESRQPSGPNPIPQAIRSEPSSGQPRARTPTPSRSSPQPSRPPSSQPNSGVVMTRPAVIVGAPKTPAQSGRIRKAREDEGRGFGQGLISEKSLDEVILAYLSEDADDK